MMGMSMSMCMMQTQELETRQEQKNVLTPLQRKELKQLLLQLQTIIEPEFPNALKGLEGMLTADRILKERGSCGILVGSLSKAVWNYRRTKEELAWHKDVDVVVPDFDFKLKEPFEGGIDWWLPMRTYIKLGNDFWKGSMYVDFYENGNNVILPGTFKQRYSLYPGLYIPGNDSVIEGYLIATLIKSSRGNEIIDSDNLIFEAFRNKLRKIIKTRVPKFIEEQFEGQILDINYNLSYYDTQAFKMESFIPEVYSKLQSLNI